MTDKNECCSGNERNEGQESKQNTQPADSIAEITKTDKDGDLIGDRKEGPAAEHNSIEDRKSTYEND